MHRVVEFVGEGVVSRVFSLVGLALLLVSVAELLRILGASAGRAVRSWAMAVRHLRRASAARAAARRSRERFRREHETTDAYGYLKLLRQEHQERPASRENVGD